MFFIPHLGQRACFPSAELGHRGTGSSERVKGLVAGLAHEEGGDPRVRQRIGTVMKWAKAKNFRSGDNPVEGTIEALPSWKRTS